ncbi:MAG TPA: hypothetical protein VE650_14220 [Acetobacteraceae bacterium]|nr:hypothetical protein [Acetobacteraceae bacterium]
MRRSALLIAAPVLAGLAGIGSGSAAELTPLTPQFVSIGDRNAVLYYTATQGGYEVVVTFAANAPDDGTSMRSVVTLMPGQQSTLSLGRAAGTLPATLTLRRTGNTLVVVPPQMQTAAKK